MRCADGGVTGDAAVNRRGWRETEKQVLTSVGRLEASPISSARPCEGSAQSERTKRDANCMLHFAPMLGTGQPTNLNSVIRQSHQTIKGSLSIEGLPMFHRPNANVSVRPHTGTTLPSESFAKHRLTFIDVFQRIAFDKSESRSYLRRSID